MAAPRRPGKRAPVARRPDPAPLQTNEFAPVIVATGAWGVACLILLTQHHSLAAHGHGWYVWVGMTGFLLGFWGLSLMLLRRFTLRRAATRGPEQHSQPPEA
jgi:protein-S-isoprenylcysteine O-methyltransferase Ste14